MRGIYVFIALAAVASGLPANSDSGKKGGLVKVHSAESKTEMLDYIHSLFEKTCHNLCLKKFPQDGPRQEACMKICRLLPYIT